MSRNFCIPLNRDDLFEASAVNQYIVENVYTVRELKMKLQDAQQDVQLHGADFVIDYDGFDIIFSVVEAFNKDITGDMKQLAMQITSDGMANLIESLSQILNTGELLEHDERIRNLNKTKMLLYLFCQLIEHIEGDQNEIDIVTGKQQKGKKKARDDDYSWNWDVERNRCVTMLYNLVQLNINVLFDPPLVEEEVTNLIANTVFKILENPNLKNQNTRDSRLSIIQVLGTICKKYNYTLSCSLKFVQHLKHFDHLVSVFAQATEVMVRDFNCNAMVMELMREISRVDGKELARDTGGTNNYAKFLVEMTEKLPKNVLPCVSLLMVHLDGESYSMRKCVLGVLGEIVIKVLSSEDLDENNKDLRENFLDVLEDHMHDVSSYVRTRVLEIWDNLCEGKCIPLNRQHRVLELAVGRLQDKSSLVRKIAVRLLTSMLNCNPYAARFNNDQLKEALTTETAKLEALVAEEVVSPSEQWGRIQEAVRKGLDEDPQGDEKVWENASPGEVVERIAMFLEKGQIGKAVALLEDAQEVMQGEDVFKPPQVEAGEEGDANEDSEPDEGEDEDVEEKEKESKSKKFPIFRNIFLESKKAPEISLSQSQEVSREKQYEVQEKMVDYLKSSLNFNIILNKSLPVIAQLLGSKQETDILEGIDFFVSAFEFGVLNAMIGVRRMLSLIWSTEKKIKDAVVSAYKRLYINPNQNNARASAATIARNLMALVQGATLGDLTSMERLVSELVASKDIGKDVFKVLWEFFIGVLPDVRNSDPKAAISLLAMAAISEPGIIRSNIEVIVNHGLGAKAETDFLLARESCVAILKLLPAKLKTDSPDPPTRFPSDHEIFKRLEILLVTGINRQKDPHFMPMAKQALNVIYQLAESPDVLAASIIKQIFKNVQALENSESSGESRVGKVETFILRRICFLAGQIALCQMNFLDVNLFCELKRRNFLKEAKREKDRAEKDKEKEKKEKEKEKKKKRTSASSTQIRSASETPRAPGGGEDEDMGVVGAEADDAEAEFIRVVCEKELVTNDSMGTNLLYLISPLILAVCRNPSKYKDPDLRASASLALSKYMLVSDEFCSTHLQLLFTVLEKSEEPVIRANLIIALGDLSFRYPNTLEPWTPKMYQRLHDTSVIVRSNTLTVLTHLILNDMIKVKGQISDMACCIVDDLERISGLAKLFFAELSKKGNTLYNVMPDIISRLSDPEVGVSEEDFRSILRYIIGLIEKDKMLEGLVEKLCHRFRATRTNRQWRDLAFCLSLFSFSDRSLRKLSDNFACWSDKLHEDSVYDSIIVILTAVKKGVGAGPVGGDKRTEAKQLAEELEARVEEARAKGVEDDTADKRAAEAKSKEAEEKAKGRKKAKKKEAEEEEDEEEEEEEEEPKKGRRSGGRNNAEEEEGEDRRKKAGRRRRNESSDEEEKTRKKKGSKTEEEESDEGSSPAGKGASKQVDDEDDSNEAKRRASHSPPVSSRKKGKSSSKKAVEPEPSPPPKRAGRGNRKR